MAFSLYDATVENYLQILGAVSGFLEKSLTHFREKGIDPSEVVETCLTHDMLPFRFQIVSVAHHSRGAMEAAKNGTFTPPSMKPDLDYAALQTLVKEASNELSILTPEAVNALVGRDVIFKLGDHTLPFTAEGFPGRLDSPIIRSLGEATSHIEHTWFEVKRRPGRPLA